MTVELINNKNNIYRRKQYVTVKINLKVTKILIHISMEINFSRASSHCFSVSWYCFISSNLSAVCLIDNEGLFSTVFSHLGCCLTSLFNMDNCLSISSIFCLFLIVSCKR